jgi:hypothetical protein
MKSVVLPWCFTLIAAVPVASANDSSSVADSGCAGPKVDVQQQTSRDCCAARICC